MLIERTISNSASVALLFVLLLLSFLLIRKISYGRGKIIVASFFSNREFKQHLKEEYFIKNYTTVFLVFLSTMSVSIVLSVLSNQFSFLNTLKITGIIVGVLSLKIAVLYALGKSITPLPSVVRSIYTLEILALIVVGIVSLLFVPVELFYSIHKVQFWLLSFLLVVYGLKIFKQFQHSVDNRVPLFYIILYFCAFELIPALTVFKILGVN